MSTPFFLHVDLDAFFASVEQLDNPEYRKKPVIVGSLPTDKRGVVSTCSYEARVFGVHSAMPIFQAYKLCPQGIYLRGRMKRYQEKSQEVMEIFDNYSPYVQQISVDEAFIDITGTEKLFGRPEETAQKLQDEVYNKTGLTVSIGIASSKYIAKIASDINKPNGIYNVKPGDEELFMSSIPLKNIWGIGKKTRLKLERSGLKTTKTILKSSENMLASIVGKNTAVYLKKALRGQLTEQFNTKPKSHSISSEKTFPVDIKDTYIIETALMDLSYEIMFRMMREGWNSKTATIKIRYEDFTTVSAQITTERCIFSAEDLYERLLMLFNKKYEKEREIRLIGCGVQNLEKSSLPQQTELFDLQNKKKQIVEKTIMEIQSKNSDLKIKKARLLTDNPATRHKFAILFALLLPLLTVFNTTYFIFATDFPSVLPAEDPESLFQYTPDDENVEFYVEGAWNSDISFTTTLTFDENNVSFSQGSPIIENTIDITAWFLLLDSWYFEANVADDFDRNTVAAGYYGDSALKHARIGNRYIDFTDIYGISKIGYGTGSTTTQSPGFMTSWGGTDWEANTLIRYDLIEDYDKTWTGLNEIDEDTIALELYSKSLRFLLPSNVIDLVSEVLVETDDSTKSDYIDANGIYYTLLDSNEYMIFLSSNTIVFSTTHTDNILIRFYTDNDGKDEKTTTESALGAWYDSDGITPSDSFLGNIANLFAIGAKATDTIIDLPELCGADNSNTSDTDSSSPDTDCFFIKTIESSYSANEAENSGSWSMYLQQNGCFSPFADYSLYTTSEGTAATSVDIISESTEAVSNEFSASIIDESSLYGGSFTDTDFFDESFSVIQVYSENDTSTLAQYPFATTNPALYIGKDSLTDLELSLQTITSVTELNIGTDANESSIQVYRNGLKESSFVYDSDDGSITLIRPPATSDTIYIRWSEYSDSSDTGIITSAIGYKKQVTDNFSFDISGSLFYPITDNASYSTIDTNTPFSASLAFNTNWNTNSISLNNTISATIEQNNISGKLQVFGMSDDPPVTLYLGSDCVIDGASEYVTSSVDRSPSDSGYELSLDWDFSADTTVFGSTFTAFQCFEFASSGESIADAQEFIIQVSGLGADIFSADDPDYTAYLQLGVSDTGEYTSLSPIKELDPNDIDDDGNITITLTDIDRNMIDDNTAVRIIIEASNLTNSDTQSGELVIGTCYANQTSFATNSPENYKSTTSQEVESPSDAGDEPAEMLLFSDDDTNYVEQLSWESDGTEDTDEFSAFIATKYTDSIPLGEYKYINFFAYFEPTDDATSAEYNNYTITISLNRQETDDTHTALSLELLPEAVSNLEGSWHTVSFNMVAQTLKIDDKTISTSNFSSYVDTDYAPTRLKISILPSTDEGYADTPSSDIRSGSLYVDEIYFSDTTLEGKIIDVLDFSWTQQNSLTNSTGFTFIDKTALYINSESFLTTPDQYTNTYEADVTTTAKLITSIPLIDIAVQANSVGSNDSDTDVIRFSGAGYTINNNYLNLENTILKDLFYASDSTTLSADGIYIIGNRNSSAKFNFTNLNIPLTITASSLAKSKISSATQEINTTLSFSPNIGPLKTVFSTEADLYQKLDDNICNENTATDTLTSEIINSSWIDLSDLQFSTGDTEASKTKTSFTSDASIFIPWCSLKPQLSLTATNTNTDTNISKNTLDFSIPFIINKQQLSLDFVKKFTTEEDAIENSYVQNYKTWKDALNTQSDFWSSYFFSSFYNQDLPNTLINICTEDSTIDSLTTTTSAGLSWQRPIFASTLDLLVPTSASTTFARDIQASESDSTDIYQLETAIASTAFNCFGTKGVKPLFNWYEQDEYINTISTTFRFNSNSRTKIATYSQVNFLINKNDYFSFTLDTSFDSDDNNSAEFETSYTWNNDICFLTDIFLYFAPQFSEGSHNVKRTEYFSVTISKDNTDSSSDIYQDWNMKHTVNIKMTDFFSLYTTAELETIYSDSEISLTDTIAIGGSFIF